MTLQDYRRPSIFCMLLFAIVLTNVTGCRSPTRTSTLTSTKSWKLPQNNEQLPSPRSPTGRSVSPVMVHDAEVLPPVAQVVPARSNLPGVVYLRPGLTLNITVLVAGKKEVEELGRRISDAGLLEVPLLGSVDVGGLPASELSALLARKYAQFYVNPQAIVDFAKDDKVDGVSPWGFVTVLGRVKLPGRIPLPPTGDMTVSGAIQRAGGFDTSAKSRSIHVTYKKSDGKLESKEIDMDAIGSTGSTKDDLLLKPDTVIYVPEQMF